MDFGSVHGKYNFNFLFLFQESNHCDLCVLVPLLSMYNEPEIVKQKSDLEKDYTECLPLYLISNKSFFLKDEETSPDGKKEKGNRVL